MATDTVGRGTSGDAGKYAEAVDHALRATEAYDDLGDPVAAGRAAAAHALALSLGVGDNAQAMSVAEPRWEALFGRKDATLALLDLSRALCNAGARLKMDIRDVLEARIKLAERTGDVGELADSLTGLSVRYGTSGATTLAGVLLEAAANLARTHHQPVALARALLNLTVQRMLDDLDKAIEVGHEAVSVARGTGVSVWISYSEINLLLALWDRGSWAETEEIIGNQSQADNVNQLVAAVVVGSMSSARGLPWSLPWADGDTPIGDDASDVAWLSFAQSLQSRARGNLEQGVQLGLDATEKMYELSGTWDDCTHMWPTAVEMALEAGEDKALTRLLDLVDGESNGPVSPGMRIHRKRVAGLVAIRDAESHEIVETTLREAIEEFEQWGAMPYRARTQAELGAWLIGQGRAGEAAPLLDNARAVFTQLGATAWLQKLESQRTTAR